MPSFRRMLVATARLTRTNEFLLRLDSGMRGNDVVVSHSPFRVGFLLGKPDGKTREEKHSPLEGQARLKNEGLSARQGRKPAVALVGGQS